MAGRIKYWKYIGFRLAILFIAIIVVNYIVEVRQTPVRGPSSGMANLVDWILYVGGVFLIWLLYLTAELVYYKIKGRKEYFKINVVLILLPIIALTIWLYSIW